MTRAFRQQRHIGRFKHAVLTICFLFLLALIAARLEGCANDPVSGPFRAVDGDTLAAGTMRLRLLGIDAPELDQFCGADDRAWPCGQVAKEALQNFVSGGHTECRGGEQDRYGRLLVDCVVAGRTVSGAMVGAGMAVPTGALSHRREQGQAQSKRVGIWAGPFTMPADWRRQRRLEGEEPRGFLEGLKTVLSLRWF